MPVDDLAGVLELVNFFEPKDNLLPAVTPYTVERAERLTGIQTEADAAVAAGKQYIPVLGYFTPGGNSWQDRFGTALIGALNDAAIPSPAKPITQAFDTVARVAGLPTSTTGVEALRNELSSHGRTEAGLLSAAGAFTEPFLGANDPVSRLGAESLAYSRAQASSQHQRDVDRFGELGGWAAGQGRSAAQSLAQSTLALVPGGQTALIAAQSGASGGEAVDEAKRAGWSDQGAIAYGATMAGIEYFTTKKFGQLGLGGAEGNVPGQVAKKAVDSLGKYFIKQLGAELAEEELIAIGQAAVRAVNQLDPNVANGLRTLDDWSNFATKTLVPTIGETALQTVLAAGPVIPLQRRNDLAAREVQVEIDRGDEESRAFDVRQQQEREESIATELDAESLTEVREEKARSILETLDEPAIITLANLNNPSRAAVKRVLGRDAPSEEDVRLALVQQAKRLVAQDDLGAWSLTEDEANRRDVDFARIERWAEQPRFAEDQGDSPAQFDARPSLETYVNAAQDLLRGDEKLVNKVRRGDPGGDFEAQAAFDIASQANWKQAARAVIRRFTAESEDRRQQATVATFLENESRRPAPLRSPEQGPLSQAGDPALRTELERQVGSELATVASSPVLGPDNISGRPTPEAEPQSQPASQPLSVEDRSEPGGATRRVERYAGGITQVVVGDQQFTLAKFSDGFGIAAVNGQPTKTARKTRWDTEEEAVRTILGELTPEERAARDAAALEASRVMDEADGSAQTLTPESISDVPAAMSPETPDTTMPDWMRETVDTLADSVKPEVANQIEELSARGQDARQIAKVLGVDKDVIRSVRSKRGIPSLDDRPTFEAWLRNRQQRVSGTPARLSDTNIEDSATRVVGQLRREDVEAVFPGTDIEDRADGWRVTFKSGGHTDIVVEDLPVTPEAIQKYEAYSGEKMTPEQVQSAKFKGAFRLRLDDGTNHSLSGLIQIHEGMSRRDTLQHEALHLARNAGFFQADEWQSLVREYSSPDKTKQQQEEDVARGIQAWDANRREGLIGRIREWLGDLLQRLGINANDKDAVQKLMRNEEFWARQSRLKPKSPQTALTPATAAPTLTPEKISVNAVADSTTTAPAERNPKEAPPGWHLAADGRLHPDHPPAEDAEDAGTARLSVESLAAQPAAPKPVDVPQPPAPQAGEDLGNGVTMTTDKAGATLRKAIPDSSPIAVRIRYTKGEWRVSDSDGRILNAGKKSAKSKASALKFAQKWLEREAEDVYVPQPGHRIVYEADGQVRTSAVSSVDPKARTVTTEAGDTVPWKSAVRSRQDHQDPTPPPSVEQPETTGRGRPDQDRRAASPGRFLQEDTPAELRVEQLGQVLRHLQTEADDPVSRQHATQVKTASTAKHVSEHAARFRDQHGDSAEAALVNEITDTVRTLPPATQVTFWASVRTEMQRPTDVDTTASAMAIALRAELGPQAESVVRQRWAAVIKAQAKSAQTFGRPSRPAVEPGSWTLSPANIAAAPEFDSPIYGRLGPMSGPLSRAPQDLVDKLPKFVGEFVGGRPTTLSTGYVAPDAAGQYETFSQTARTNVGDFDTAAHEVGHDLLARSNLMASLASTPSFGAIDRELTTLGMALYGQTVPPAGYQAEGFCEFLRFAIGDPSQAKQVAPETFLWFGTELAARPAAAKAFDAIQQQATRWVGTPAADRYATLMQSGTAVKRGTWTVEKVVRYAWDGIAGLRQFTTAVDKARLEQGLPELPVHLRPSERARRVVGTAPGVTAQFIGDVRAGISQGSVEWATNRRNGESLLQILKPITGKGDKPLKDFGVYLWARRTLAFARADAEAEASGQTPRAVESGMMRTEAAQVVAELEQRYPEFRRMAQGVYRLMGRVNKYMKDASPTLDAVATQIEAGDVGDYVPLHRLFQDYDDAFANFAARHGGKSSIRHGKFTEEITGSTRPPADVLEQLQLEIERRVQLAHERFVLESVVNIAEPGNEASTSGLGQFITRIEGTPEVLARALKDPRIVAVLKDGQTLFFEVSEPMADALKGVSMSEAQLLNSLPVPKVVDHVLSFFNRTLKLGAVGWNPSFVLLKGAWQDTIGMLSKSSTEGKPGAKLAALLTGYHATLQWAATGKSTPEIELLLNSGFLSTSSWTNERTAHGVLQRAAIDGAEISRRQGWAVVTNVAEAVEKLGAAMQMGPMLAEMKLTAQNLGTSIESASSEQQVQILNSGKALMPFAEKGVAFKLADRWLPFASIPLTATKSLVEFGRKNPKAAAIRLGASWGAMILMYLLRRDDEWWQSLDERQKFGGFAINRGPGQSPMFIPFNSTEMQLGLGLPLAVLSSFEKSDPTEAGNLLSAMGRQFVPNLNPLMEQAIKQATNTKDFRYGTELVTRPAAEDNWTADTTLLARWFGTQLGIAPTRVDSALDDFTGGLVPGALRTAEGLAGQRLMERADVPVFGGVYQRGTDVTATAKGWRERFYRLRDRFESMSEAERAEESPLDTKIRTTVNNAAEALSHLQALARSARTLEERHQWDTEAVEIAKEVLSAVEDERPLPWVGRRASRLEKERKALNAR